MKKIIISIVVAISFAAGAGQVDVSNLSDGAEAFNMPKRLQKISVNEKVPEKFKDALFISMRRGNGKEPGNGFSFYINRDCDIYIIAMGRGGYSPEGWEKTRMKAAWTFGKVGSVYNDLVFKKHFKTGKVVIPPHDGGSRNRKAYGVPNTAVIIGGMLKKTEVKKRDKNAPRRVIFNNDCTDILYYPNRLPHTYEGFLKRRLNDVAGSNVDSIFYNVNVGITYNLIPLKSGTMRTIMSNGQHKSRSMHCATQEFHKKGTDVLKMHIRFCRENNMEIFASFRMNDIHDSYAIFEVLIPPWKNKNRDLLIGPFKSKKGTWSAVNYAESKVRKIVTDHIFEIMENYDIDGLEMDFGRWPILFKATNEGNKASDAERKMMIDFLKKVKEHADSIGKKRGRKIILAMRVPESLSYCYDIGLDMQNIIKDKLVDIVIGGSYRDFDYNPIDFVKLCHKYGIPYYVSIETALMSPKNGYRRKAESFRGRSMQGLAIGADGIYYFNLYGNKEYYNKHMTGTKEQLKTKDKRYFANWSGIVKDKKQRGFLPDLSNYVKIDEPSPRKAKEIQIGKSLTVKVFLADDFKELSKECIKYNITANLFGIGDFVVSLKGKKLEQISKEYNPAIYKVPADLVVNGENYFNIKIKSGDSGSYTLLKGGKFPLGGKTTAHWRRLSSTHDKKNSEKIVDGGLLIRDSGKGKKQAANLVYQDWFKNAVINFKLKVLNSDAPSSVCIRLANSKHVEVISFQKDKIELINARQSIPFNTSDKFHQYSVSFNGNRLIFKADGKNLFNTEVNAPVRNKDYHVKTFKRAPRAIHAKSILIGSLSGQGTGAGIWKDITITGHQRHSIRDFFVDVCFPEGK